MRKYNLYCAFLRGANYESKEDYFYRIGCSSFVMAMFSFYLYLD